MNPLQANKQINLLSSFINCSELSKVTDFLLDFLNFRNQNESEGIIAKALNTIDVKDPKLVNLLLINPHSSLRKQFYS